MVPVHKNIIFCLSKVIILILCVEMTFSTDCVPRSALAYFAMREAKCMELLNMPPNSLVTQSKVPDNSDNTQKAIKCLREIENEKYDSLCKNCPMCNDTLKFIGSAYIHNNENYQAFDEFSLYISKPELYCRSDTYFKVYWNTTFDNLTAVYLVERTDPSGMNWIPVGNAKKNVVNVRNLMRNTTYKVRVHAFTVNGKLGASVTSDWLRTLSGCDEVKATVNATSSIMETYNDHALLMLTWDTADDLSCIYEIDLLDNHGNIPTIVNYNKFNETITVFANVSYDMDYTCFITNVVNEPCDKFMTREHYALPCLDILGYNYTFCVPPAPQLPSASSWVINETEHGSYVIDIEVQWEWLFPEYPDIFIVKVNLNLAKNNTYSKVLNISGEENYANFTALDVDEKEFTYSIRACGQAGCSEPVKSYYEVNVTNQTKWQTLVSIILPLILFLVLIAIGSWLYYAKLALEREKVKNANNQREEDLENNMPLISPEDVPDVWRIPYEHLIFEEKLGEGAFGVVHKGLYQDKKEHWCHIAIKKLQDPHELADLNAFKQEINVMKLVGQHPNIVSIIGYCSDRRNLCLVVEYCPYGDLCNYLRKETTVVSEYESEINHEEVEKNAYGMPYAPMQVVNANSKETRKERDVKGLRVLHVDNKLYMDKAEEIEEAILTVGGKNNFTPFDLLSYARQIALGMEHLAKNRVVHRDLAARNILVVSHRKVKISDFGLSRDVYEKNYYRKKDSGRLPVKWMAIESLEQQLYTTQSDVWSFGILLWEIVTLGASPYPGMDPRELFKYLQAGYRMERPKNCSEELFKIMQSCWAEEPRDRPRFFQLRQKLEKLIEASTSVNYLEIQTSDL